MKQKSTKSVIKNIGYCTILIRKRVIKVVTAVGESNEEEVQEGLGQGTQESTTLSSVSIARGIRDFFRRSE